MDGALLLSMLVRYAGGETKLWSVVEVPTAEQEDARQLLRELMALRGSFGRAANGQDPNTIVTAIGLLLSDLIHHIATLKGLASEDRDYYIDLAEALWRNLGDWVRRAREGDKPA